MASPDSRPTVVVHGGGGAPATLLGQGPARLPTGGKIRAGIKVLTRHAAELPRARAIYDQGVAQGQSFEQIALALADALPELKSPLVPRNVPWFTVRAQDFPNPALAAQILATHGEDRGEGVRLYRFPVVFPTDRWQSVMPHELAAWGAHDKRFWSEYSADGRVRHCMTHAPVPVDSTGRRTIRLFGGRKTVLRPDNAGLCQPEACAEYQQRQCNLSGRFLFFIPGIRSISAFELHTNSFYALNAAIQKFETVAFLRGGRIAGFLDSQRTPFYLTKRLMEVAHIDELGRAVRLPQWIIELEAPVDVSALMRENEDLDTALIQADLATQVLQGPGDALPAEPCSAAAPMAGAGGLVAPVTPVTPDDATPPTLAQVLGQAADMGIAAEQFQAYAQRRWGPGWMLNPRGRQRAWTELARYVNDPPGYADKIGTELQAAP